MVLERRIDAFFFPFTSYLLTKYPTPILHSICPNTYFLAVLTEWPTNWLVQVCTQILSSWSLNQDSKHRLSCPCPCRNHRNSVPAPDLPISSPRPLALVLSFLVHVLTPLRCKVMCVRWGVLKCNEHSMVCCSIIHLTNPSPSENIHTVVGITPCRRGAP